VHKPFYASGFLYHSPSQQILLQQTTADSTSALTLFRAKSRKGETPQAVFQRSISETLGITLKENSILPVYDYIHATLGEQYIFYVKITGSIESLLLKDKLSQWFLLAKLGKQNLTEQTKHDIIIAERVIRDTEERKKNIIKK